MLFLPHPIRRKVEYRLMGSHDLEIGSETMLRAGQPQIEWRQTAQNGMDTPCASDSNGARPGQVEAWARR